ncbi:f132b_human ame: full=protein fam132b flags: [Lynx pardinus]|uniref:Erythroferrone n=1 Tax=Lynx pardinus TaxID=191816 RepID=A0A485N7B0_LYNPA|nr:f132b_human ame: full=protein fam132b flags: [Lynx pardinus]
MAPARRPAGARLLLVCAGLLAAAAGFVSPEPGEPAESRARQEPRPGNELPAENRAGPPARPPEPPAEGTQGIEPRDAWMLLIRQSDKGVNGKRGGRGKAKKLKLGFPGPPGPPGPQGPPGPIIPPEVLLKELQLLLKGAVRQRERAEPEPCTRGPAQRGVGGRRTVLTPTLSPASPLPSPALSPGGHSARATHHRPRLFCLRAGTFQPWPGPRLAFLGTRRTPLAPWRLSPLLWRIQFGCHPPPEDLARTAVTTALSWAAVVCRGGCEHRSSLEAVMGLESSSELFTISVNGVLYLQMGQYASVFLDNASGSSLTVRSGSHFSAVLLGV